MDSASNLLWDLEGLALPELADFETVADPINVFNNHIWVAQLCLNHGM